MNDDQIEERIATNHTKKYNEDTNIIYLTEDNKYKSIKASQWEETLGIPVGVEVIPASHNRHNNETTIIALNDIIGHTSMWGTTGNTDVVSDLIEYKHSSGFPIMGDNGYRTWVETEWYSPVDVNFNPVNVPMNICISDFDGAGNTEKIIAFQEDKEQNSSHNYAAYKCTQYGSNEAERSVDWYLPAAGELAYFWANKGGVFKALNKLGDNVASVPSGSYYIWSSTQYSYYGAWRLTTSNGYMTNDFKNYNRVVRPFGRVVLSDQ